jgi:hypothetical protein
LDGKFSLNPGLAPRPQLCPADLTRFLLLMAVAGDRQNAMKIKKRRKVIAIQMAFHFHVNGNRGRLSFTIAAISLPFRRDAAFVSR